MKQNQHVFIPNQAVSEIFRDSRTIFYLSNYFTRLLFRVNRVWLRLAKQSLEEQMKFMLDSDNGLIIKTGGKKDRKKDVVKNKRDVYDFKIYLHWRHNTRQRLKRKNINLDKYERFFLDLDELLKYCVAASVKLGSMIEKRMPGKSFVKQIKGTKQHVIRLLYYPDRNSFSASKTAKAFLAQPHGDVNLWTFALLESAPGLCLGPKLEYEHIFQKNQALVFMGGKCDHMTNKNVPLVIHAVKNKGAGERTSTVFFGHSRLGRKFTQTYTKKRESEIGKKRRRKMVNA